MAFGRSGSTMKTHIAFVLLGALALAPAAAASPPRPDADQFIDFAVDGAYRTGASEDGIHPTPMVAFAVGRTIREALLGGAGG